MKMYVMLTVALSLGLTACSGKTRETEHINKSLQENQKADSYLAWESSEANPERLFVDWNRRLVAKEIETSGLCGDFNGVPAEDLVLFENQIRSEQNKALLLNCQAALITKLDEYWAANRPVVDTTLGDGRTYNNFKFPDNVQYRDLENGYFGVSGDVGNKEVVLTFDDGPSNLYTQQILDSMREVNGKGIFFMTGNNVRKYPRIVQEVANEGHAVGGHSMNHLCLASNSRCKSNNEKSGSRMLNLPEAMADIKGTFKEIFKALGFADPFFRFPYGESSPELKSYLKANQVGEFYWSIDSDDWRKDKDGMPWTPTRMVDDIMNQLSRNSKNRGMILVHDIHKKTAEAVPLLLQKLYYGGYSLVLLKAENSDNVANPTILRNSDSGNRVY